MSSANLGWLFYKGYYSNLTHDDYLLMLLSKDEKKHRENEVKALESKIDTNIQNLITQTVTLEDNEILGNTHFKATTTYPGLILGSGNAHELPDVKGQAILGFSFDYTSGLPIIAGSSIKGVLRSAFKHWEYIAELTGLETKEEIEALETEVFDNGDIFFDAEVVSIGTKLLGDDYITPHKDPLKNPIPLRFIKVMPNVTFRFDFELSSGVISKSKKAKLFQHILSDLGLGAKTNVGYGKFDNFKKEQTEDEKALEKLEREEEAFDNAIKSKKVEQLEVFKRDFPNSEKNIEIDKAIEEIKKENEITDIKKAFENLDKSKKNHIEAFIKKYENNSNATEFITQLKQSSPTQKNNPPKQQGAEALNSAKNGKQFKTILQMLTIDDNTKTIIEENIIRICEELNKKKKQKFFREIKLENYIDKKFKEKMMEKVGI